MFKKGSVFIAALLCLTLFGACGCVDDNPTTAPADAICKNRDHILSEDNHCFNETLPSGTPMFFSNLSDFLTEEQIQLYNKAKKIYPIFRRAPEIINYLHLIFKDCSRQEITEYVANYQLSDDMIRTYTINGAYYHICKGEYQTIEALNELCLSVFTDDYYTDLNCTSLGIPMFIQINEYLYYMDAISGTAFGYSPAEIPDTYELISRSDTEICFNVIGHYKSSNVDPNYTVETKSYPITLTFTDNEWRFAKFADAAMDS